ncbi:MAG: SDR family NAD(P)-dependent oxidoreductase [Anaerolineae bacterium]|nr:SDR family NAD(P)-dependent oxidoreductase [Anaerolineae bacterium]
MKLPEELQFIANARMPQKTTNARMDGRVCVVTGATSGVGLAAVRRLARGGAQVVLVCRNAEKAATVQAELAREYGTQTDVVLADFARLADVRAAGATLLERYPHIDVLINNAGVHMTHRMLTVDGHETAFGVNHLASFLLTCLLLDRLKASAPARIIQVNSQGHRFGGLDLDDLTWARRRYKGLQGYGASKTAQLLTVWELADRLTGSGVTINAMHPGAVKSNIGMNNGLLYRLYNRLVIRPFLKDAAISGDAIYYLAAAPEMANVSRKFFNLTIEEKPAAHALDRAVGKRIWAISNQLSAISSQPSANEKANCL